jgi:crotonobetaine/carnitine-CoA ligase
LRRNARDRPNQLFVQFEDGSAWTYRQAEDAALRAAAAFQALGVGPRDRVLSWLPNGPDALRVWFGSNLCGAVYTPVNIAYRGQLLEHVIRNSGARTMVVHAELLPRLCEADLGGLELVIVAGGDAAPAAGARCLPVSVLEGTGLTFIPPADPVQPWDDYAVIYTSGTTGPSKGVRSTYIQLYEGVRAAYIGCGVTADDRYLLQVPLFHLGGIIGVYAMAVVGGSVVMVSAFDTARFWTVVGEHGITVCTLLGAMASFLERRSPQPSDANNPLRLVFMVPLVRDVLGFARRFGVELRTMFSMTEVPPPLISEPKSTQLGSCGRLRDGLHARIVDTHDREVPTGETGELILRSDLPWSITHGYLGAPDATAAAWRNGWFHTGDAFRRDGAANYYFVDRIKDYIRRRGENISSFELEAEVLAHPAVREVAAVAVPSEDLEDEILVVAAPKTGAAIDPAELIGFLSTRVPHFMVPRYVRLVDALPKTPTAKVRKQVLRDEGVTTDTFDREQAAIRVKRDRIGER